MSYDQAKNHEGDLDVRETAEDNIMLVNAEYGDNVNSEDSQTGWSRLQEISIQVREKD